MINRLLFIVILSLPSFNFIEGQVRVRVFAERESRSAILTITEGEYDLITYGEDPLPLKRNDMIAFSIFNGRIALKPGKYSGFTCDSLMLKDRTGRSKFALRIVDGGSGIRNYSGALDCFYDLGLIVFINTCETEEYIAGVVRAEGGPGRNAEYCKAQAVIARSYLHRNILRHTLDNYNVCDNIHCQVFFGITEDALIRKAALDTKGLVALDRSNGSVIVPAFHSNCGGVTSNASDVWLSDLPYLKKVSDPHCVRSRNATWRKSMPLSKWTSYLKDSGLQAEIKDPAMLNFSQITRHADYRIGSFSIPFRQIRSDLDLRSAFFSVVVEGENIVLKGRGYGHGVGLCQEGAMAMAAKGFTFRQIIDFYYTGVVIADISDAVPLVDIFAADNP